MLLLDLYADGTDRAKVMFYHPEYDPLELTLIDCLKGGWAVYSLSSADHEMRDAAREYEWRRLLDGVTIAFDRFRTGECRIMIDASKSVRVWRKKIDPNRRESADDPKEGVRRYPRIVPGTTPDAAVQTVRQGEAPLPAEAVRGVREEA